MPITVSEKWDSREGTTGESASTDLRYIIRGTDDDAAARDALVANSPAFYNLLIRQSAHIARLGEDTWEGTVRYGTSSPPQTGQSSFSFDTGGGSQHITQGRGTVARYSAPGKTAPNFGGAIGVTQDNVEGVDIYVPVYNFSETHHIDPADVTGAYKSTTCLFDRVRQQRCVQRVRPRRGAVPGSLWHAARPGGLGDHLQVRRQPECDRSGHRRDHRDQQEGLGVPVGAVHRCRGHDRQVLVKKPIAVYVEQVYPMAAFAGLGIGAEASGSGLRAPGKNQRP